jgi:hypothetical protein
MRCLRTHQFIWRESIGKIEENKQDWQIEDVEVLILRDFFSLPQYRL